uniref:transglycosylase family protein n=1 Tax=Streptomyces polyasparticus TaxID=2767826 RepID=UPI0027B8CE03|nr:transglycosylase family protein [Streptomyces polyasparticus]
MGSHRKPRPRRGRRSLSAGFVPVGASLFGALATPTASAASVSTWDQVAACERSENWQINSGNGIFGGLQFSQSTWEEFGGGTYASRRPGLQGSVDSCGREGARGCLRSPVQGRTLAERCSRSMMVAR